MTLISLIYKHYKPYEYKSCIFWMIWMASLSFAGFARWETGPENPQGCGRCLFWWWMNFLGPEASGRSGRVDRSIVLSFFSPAAIAPGFRYQSWICWVRIQCIHYKYWNRYTYHRFETVHDSLYTDLYIYTHDTEICVTDGVASLSFAGLARCESGPENQQGCRGCCFFLWWMNFLGPETSLSYLSYLSLSSLDITENESLT